ncbi:DUF3891 family protein [Rubrobacter indicoceani]|uniref:DUF3891 family protein n=1 Tax=Rubrobacter indicoceani TaxID=2051957 RepID=UPI000E5C35B4|nr:DUF3891 family protein [Rubrobacter indicoceani]
MIIRRIPEGFLLIQQHEHGLLSGEFARNLSTTITKGRLTDEVLEAIANHDRAWQAPDSQVLWNEKENRPYSFLDHPPAPKTTAYTAFLDEMESEDPYTGLLCSAHYGSLVKDSDDVHEQRFADSERGRRERLRRALPDGALEEFSRDFAVLQFSDDLSLFICLNDPGKNEHPWYRDGMQFLEEKIMPVWRDGETLTFEPYPFVGEFEVKIPYRISGADRSERGAGFYRVGVSP